MNFKAFAVLALFALSACGGDNKWATDAQMAAPSAHFVAEPPRTITLFTVQSTRNGSGAHSGLLINASEQVMFDPAGTWYHPYLPERGDVHYGVTPRMVSFYIDYHARETFNVIEQTVVVTPEVAELVKQRAEAYGSVPSAQCAHSVSSILHGVPGFEAIGNTWYPNKLMKEFAQLPGVTRKLITDDDADNNHGVIMKQVGEVTQ
ncbi:MAG: hypothetical protein JWS10_2265 [Cypionkella sp.]|uniref:hypothetical protein n=1 Tax=Cypionkella sp. TaxID=2811411 RepID=UPI00261DDDE2|nr:hypothetical protein [Cypionkella sp.]MDB5659650.1 hypothetical protein [Cypionkella sp.]MDB5665339.1 hypothetical protein [Cypionkella sp.]